MICPTMFLAKLLKASKALPASNRASTKSFVKAADIEVIACAISPSNVFANSSAEVNGVSYMMGGTGGYLLGYCFAISALGYFANLNWDRNIFKLGAALLFANILIYGPGLLWLGQLYGWDQPILAWGLTPFIFGDLMKLALTASLIPLIWKLVDKFK